MFILIYFWIFVNMFFKDSLNHKKMLNQSRAIVSSVWLRLIVCFRECVLYENDFCIIHLNLQNMIETGEWRNMKNQW